MKSAARPHLSTVVVLALMAALFSWAGAADAARSGSAPTVQASTSDRTIARSPRGKLASRIVGETAAGRPVTGTFIPLQVKRTADGAVAIRGLVKGQTRNATGRVVTFAALRDLRLESVNGVPATAGAARADVTPQAPSARTCDILHLVLGPLDLDLLGLQIHLDRVVLDIVAQTGAGNLLGNLLCAVTGLLDGGLGGALGQLTTLLNQILDLLRLGV